MNNNFFKKKFKTLIIPIIVSITILVNCVEENISELNDNTENILPCLSNTLDESKATNINCSYTIYRTNTGKKYHKSQCKYLNKSCIEISIEEELERNLKPCSICMP